MYDYKISVVGSEQDEQKIIEEFNHSDHKKPNNSNFEHFEGEDPY